MNSQKTNLPDSSLGTSSATSPDIQQDSPLDLPITIAATPQKQHNNPLHGLTLEAILTALVADLGWAELAERIPVRCFSYDPSMASSLKFLRKTPWARDKVENLYTWRFKG